MQLLKMECGIDSLSKAPLVYENSHHNKLAVKELQDIPFLAAD